MGIPQKNHCDIAQGYLMGKPMNAADFVKHLYLIE